MSPVMFNGPSEGASNDVVVVGAGPAGLMLATNLARFGNKVHIIDERPDKTSTGRADGIQPKSIETFRQMRLCDKLMRKGVKLYDMCFWKSTPEMPMHRVSREIHYPEDIVDVTDPYILLTHQGMVEEAFIDDMAERGVEVQRSTIFEAYSLSSENLAITCSNDGAKQELSAKYLVGCDGAHSRVRKCILGAQPAGSSSEAIWGVLDGELDTDFPDIWSKVIVSSEGKGSILFIPRERNMTRLYIEIKSEGASETVAASSLTEESVMNRAREIMAPFKLNWKSVEWFGRYQIGQRVAGAFTDKERVFIAGDASHSHSPKAAQGLNTSIHDSWNLAWKLNLAIRGLAKPSLLATYQDERRKIAQDLINFDYEHANAFANGNPQALVENFKTNIRFISGVGATYTHNPINIPFQGQLPFSGALQEGTLLPPVKVTRYIDANPVEIQNVIPMLGQFRIFFLTTQIKKWLPFLQTVSSLITSPNAVMARASAAAAESYKVHPRPHVETDDYDRPERYLSASELFTYGVITSDSYSGFELSDFPDVLQKSKWNIYIDDVVQLNGAKQFTSCIQKWLGGLTDDTLALVVVRPDGYVGAVSGWDVDSAQRAAQWLDGYFDGFLEA